MVTYESYWPEVMLMFTEVINGEKYIPFISQNKHALVDCDDGHLKFHLHCAQQTMKKYVVDVHRMSVSFTKGDWMYIKLQPHAKFCFSKD